MREQPAYNKTSIRLLERQISLRRNALPALKMRETTLRANYIKILQKQKNLITKINDLNKNIAHFHPLLSGLILADIDFFEIEINKEKIAGVRIPVLKQVIIKPKQLPQHAPYWLYLALPHINEWYRLNADKQVTEFALIAIDNARKKITRKINLFEKVQIPDMELQIMKIKNYLNDTESLSSAIQKLSKKLLIE
ncbi:MAG: V-type ATP synthase subunit D [Bacteroidia bacterium]